MRMVISIFCMFLMMFQCEISARWQECVKVRKSNSNAMHMGFDCYSCETHLDLSNLKQYYNLAWNSISLSRFCQQKCEGLSDGAKDLWPRSRCFNGCRGSYAYDNKFYECKFIEVPEEPKPDPILEKWRCSLDWPQEMGIVIAYGFMYEDAKYLLTKLNEMPIASKEELIQICAKIYEENKIFNKEHFFFKDTKIELPKACKELQSQVDELSYCFFVTKLQSNMQSSLQNVQTKLEELNRLYAAKNCANHHLKQTTEVIELQKALLEVLATNIEICNAPPEELEQQDEL